MYKRLVPAVLLVAYVAFLVKWMVLKDVPLIKVGTLMLNFGGTAEGQPNFVPFTTIVPYLFGYKGLIIAGINLVGNIVLLVPLGFFVPLVYPSITWKKSLALAAASGLVIETAQVLLRVGIFDIDDVILNALGFMVGYWMLLILAKLVRSKNGILIACIGGVIVIAAVLYGYQKFPIRLEAAPSGTQSDRLGNGGGGGPQGNDLCGGTGGNGQIVSVAGNSFAMERNDGGTQTVALASGAEIHTPTGPGSVSDLKAGDRVTLVGDAHQDGSFTADAVFVCTGAGPV